MINFTNDGTAVRVTAPYALTSGQGVQVGTGLFGVATEAIDNGAVGVIHRTGRYTITKFADDNISAGAILYWDNTNRRLTTTSSTHIKAGIAAAAAGATITVVDAILTGQA